VVSCPGSPERCCPARWISQMVSGAGPVSSRDALGSPQHLLLGLCVAQVLPSQRFHFCRKHLGPAPSAGLQRGSCGASQPHSVSSARWPCLAKCPCSLRAAAVAREAAVSPSQRVSSGKSLAECCPAELARSSAERNLMLVSTILSHQLDR